MLTREILHFARERGFRFVDYGITEAGNQGLRSFKRRMGFGEQADVVSLVEVRTPQPIRAASAVQAPPAMRMAREDIPLLEFCNFSCGFCYREPWVPKLTAAEVKRRIDDIFVARPFSGIAFSGGEPTLWGDLGEVIRYARARGIDDVQLHSNGWKAADAQYALELAHAGLTSAMVSLHSHRADRFAEITGTRPEYFARTLCAIDNLRNAGIYVLLSHVINALNGGEFSAYIEFVAGRFPGAEIFVFLVYPSVKGQHHPHLYPRLTAIRGPWQLGLHKAQELGVRITVDSLA